MISPSSTKSSVPFTCSVTTPGPEKNACDERFVNHDTLTFSAPPGCVQCKYAFVGMGGDCDCKCARGCLKFVAPNQRNKTRQTRELSSSDGCSHRRTQVRLEM